MTSQIPAVPMVPFVQPLTREDWLRSAAELVVQWSGLPDFPRYQVSVGYPPGGRIPGSLGQTLLPKGKAGTPDAAPCHIFISAEITGDQGTLAFSTLVHELAHVASGCKHRESGGHGINTFGVKAAMLGLLPPWETTPTHLQALDELYQVHVGIKGLYPHSGLEVKPPVKGRMVEWHCTGEKCIDPETKKIRNVKVRVGSTRKIRLFCLDCGTLLVPQVTAADADADHDSDSDTADRSGQRQGAK